MPDEFTQQEQQVLGESPADAAVVLEPDDEQLDQRADRSVAATGAAGDSAAKPVDEWVTGDEPMTGAQASYLETLAREAGEEVDTGLTKAEASKRIDELQARTGRGT